MNDRFKYRVFDYDDNEMHDVIEIMYREDNTVVEWLNSENKKRSAFIGEVPIVQSTGLKDKNGKLIYEGDIVTYDWLTPIGKVWRTDSKHIVEWQNGFTVIGNIAGYDVEHGKTRNVEVIGNIYENKELLDEN